MTKTYRHTQFGTVIVGGLAGSLALTLVMFWLVGGPLALVSMPLVILVVCLLLFPTLTTEVEPERVHCFFGFGLIRRRIAVRDIERVAQVRNSWINGWGIRLIPDGWLWNVSGLDAVELTLRGGRRFRIGTDRPEDLLNAIQQYLRAG